ncbi:hypothetical protein KJF94_07120 [Pseudomonas hormoni]|uniref:CopG family transcriptional regulator n=1 Tax=Pseudomonas hormoni TaxID=3093767 RepID=A0ABX8F051_9PSED|nr:hypothetical protein [Pseudomonas hormoni]QVW25337.1 hypothetical protein KJF94_07120 [Pseudomonas hormoni]
MNFLEPAVLLDQQQMDVLERVANNAGITGEELVRQTLKRVLDSLEQAEKANRSPPSNVFRLPLKR